MSEGKPKIYEFGGRYYARTATGGCRNCVFGSGHDALCTPHGHVPKFIALAHPACLGDGGPAFEEVEKPVSIKTPKKHGTTHSEPTAKGVRAEKKTATVKPKYPAARVQRELIAEATPLEKRTKAQLISTAEDLAIQFHNLAADHCIAGTKLDRAIVDLKEAKAKIKELTK